MEHFRRDRERALANQPISIGALPFADLRRDEFHSRPPLFIAMKNE